MIVSSGGFPHDINLIQAHKALDMAALACNDGGTIVLLAECSDGLGRPDFLKWFDARDSRALAARLVNGYEVNGQTAWALLTKAERFRVCLVSELPPDDVRRMRMVPVRTIEEALEQARNGDGFIMPRGAAVLPLIRSQRESDVENCTVRNWEWRDRDAIVRYANNRKVSINLRDRFPYPYTARDARNWLDMVVDTKPETNFAIDVAGRRSVV